MIPNIGKKVYIIYEDSITLAKVGYVGARSFIIEDWENCFEDSIEYFYDDYGRDWFTNFAAAKKRLIEDYSDLRVKLKLVKKSEGYWELE